MAIIPQKKLFGWREVEELGDLERLVLVLESMPDERLVRAMEEVRYKGRDDYPVRAVWNSILAGIVYEHNTIASLRRELKRNAQLRELCGFDPWKGVEAVPTDFAYSRFLNRLMTTYSHLVEEMFNSLVETAMELLPDFGSVLAIDGKALPSFANGKSDQKPDGRRDVDGDWGKKVYKGNRADGTPYEKVVKWFGYRLHLIVDAEYEHYGIECEGQNQCPVSRGIRIKMSENRRLFTPIARSSYKWGRSYKKRTAVERVNSRIDGFFNFENHNIRGLQKMNIRCGLAFCVMLSMAVGRVRQERPDLMRSLVASA